MALAAKLAFLLGPLLLTGKTIKCHRKAVFLMAITWLFEKRNFLLPSGFLICPIPTANRRHPKLSAYAILRQAIHAENSGHS